MHKKKWVVEIFEFLKKRNRKKKSVDFSGVAFHDLMQFLNIDENCDRLSEVTYFTCMKVLGEGLSKLPLALQRVTSDGGVEDMQGLPLWETVKVRPNRFMSPTTFWNTVENNRNHWGNAYVWINRKIGGNVELWILPSECMQIELDQLSDLSDMNDITYVYTSPYSGQIFHIPSMDILHFKGSMIFNGLIGMSVREKLKMSLDSAMLSQKMLNELYKNHFVPKAAVQFDVNSFVEKDLETEYLKGLQEYADGKNANGTSFIPLLPGTTIVPLNIRLTDGQFLELRKYTALQIAAAFGIKPNHLNDYEKSSYANSEAQQLAFYTDTMLYILKQYEEELNFKLLSEMQRAAGFRFKFNLAAVLRGDTKTQVESLSRGISSGLYTPDEARRNLDLPAKPGGDRLYFNGSNIPIDLAGTQYQMQAQNENTKAMLKLAESIEKVLGCGIMNINKGWVTINGKPVYIGASAKGSNKFEKGFKNKQKRNNHFSKHSKEFKNDGIITPEKYEERALELVQSACNDNILGYKNSLDHIVRYDVSKNDFVKGHQKTGVFTLYKPCFDEMEKGNKKAGLEYFLGELAKEGIENDE